MLYNLIIIQEERMSNVAGSYVELRTFVIKQGTLVVCLHLLYVVAL